MAVRPIRQSSLLSRACRLGCLIALGALLAGCDKCGDWFWSHADGQPQVCRQQGPKPQ